MAMKSCRRWNVLVALLMSIGLTACSAGASPDPSVTASAPTGKPAASSASAAPSDGRATASPAVARCPNPDGGRSNRCLGMLKAGTYSTEAFQPHLRYTVPAGWGNFEDLPGQVLLLPPGATLEGVNPGTSDTVGIYTSIAAPLKDCSSIPDPAVGATVRAYVGWLQTHPGLDVSRPSVVHVGALTGTKIDVALRPDATGTCSDPAMNVDRFAEVAIGQSPSDLSASVLPHGHMLLDLFDVHHRVLAIIVGDAQDRGSDDKGFNAAAQSVIDSFKFDVTP